MSNGASASEKRPAPVPNGMKRFAQAENGDVADPETGELYEQSFVAVHIKKPRNGFSDGWVAMSQSAVLQIAQSNLGQDALRVFLALSAHLDFNNLIQVCQSDISKTLNMRQPNVHRAIKKLVKAEIILEGPRIGKHRSYRLNPYFGWKGSAKAHHEALQAQKQKVDERRTHLRVIEGGSGTGPAESDELFEDKVEGQGELELS